MIPGASAVKHDLVDALGPGCFRRDFADAGGSGHIGRQLPALRDGFAQRRNRGQRMARGIVDELHVDVLFAEPDAHPGTLRRAGHLLADTPVAAQCLRDRGLGHLLSLLQLPK